MKSLTDAGTTITASPEQAKRLREADGRLEGLITVSETEKSSIDEKEVDVQMADLQIEPKRRSKKVVDEDLEVDLSDDAESEDDLDEGDAHLLGKFVDLCDLLPPLPQKGSFDVETIKKSQYFFS